MDSPYAHLREEALAYAETATVPYPVCTKRELQIPIVELQQQWAKKKAELDDYDPSADTDRSLSEEPAADRLARELADLEEQVTAAREEARPHSITLLFGQIASTDDAADDGESWEALVKRHTINGKTDTSSLQAELPRLTYRRAEAPDGTDLDLDWRTAARLLDVADMRMLRQMLWGHNHYGAAVPFDPRTSGTPATS